MNEELNLGKELSDYDLHEMYDQMLDDAYGTVSIGGYEYSTSDALKEVDPIAYDTGFNDWLDAEINEENIIEHDGVYYLP